jgi:phenylacetate-CoA ligase
MVNKIIFSLICPCLNEEGNIDELAERFFKSATMNSVSSEIVFIDDGSNDGTWGKMNEIKNRYPDQVVLVQHPKNKGIPYAWKSGIESATGSIVGLIDSDLQNPPESAIDLYRCLVGDSLDLVRGVRRPTFYTHVSRRIMSKMLNSLLNYVFGMRSSDNKSGFIVGKVDVMLKMVNHTENYNHFQTFIGVSTRRLAIRQLEVVTPFMRRSNGESFLNGKTFKTTLEVLRDIPKAMKEYGWRRIQ